MEANNLIQRVTELRISRVRSHERPHKPALVLAILAMIDSGRLSENQLVYGPELFELFRKHLDVVRSADDALNMLDPFWRLKSDGLLEHQPKPDFKKAMALQSTPPTVGQLRECVSHSQLPDAVFEQLCDPLVRERVRQAVVGRYFAEHAEALDQLALEEREIGDRERMLEDAEGDTLPEAPDAIRDQAFRRVVLRAYDYRCAACGLRVVLDDLILVEAAHLVPWQVSRDDDPCNGMALCKNHHWAMDRLLIAPTAKLRWQVSGCLDDRIEGQRDLLDLRDRSVLLPIEIKFRPKDASLQWRVERLRSA